MSSPGEAGVIVNRNVGGIIANVTVQERHRDQLEITKHPVEIGAAITDHAYKEPAELTIIAGWSNSSEDSGGDDGYVEDIYQQLLALQLNRQPIQVVTGKRTYDNMLFRAITTDTDEKTEHALIVTADLRQIILVNTVTTSVTPQGASSQPASQKSPGDTSQTAQHGTVQLQPAPTYNNDAGKGAGILDTQGTVDITGGGLNPG